MLTAYGRAYGVLTDKSSDVTPEQRAFLEQSVAGLAQDGKVISVRLALFAEMVKGKPWTPATLKDVGGTEGVGVAFLEETFGANTAPPEHRLHQKAAQAVLKALLPRTGTDIKGQMRSESELREASGYAGRPRDFDDLISILDSELRLITPTDPEGSSGESQPSSPGCQPNSYYQLTHDYLVHSLRHWLTRKQRETRRGRAELRLAERAAIWEARPESRHLPSISEWANIRILGRPKDWTDPQRRMMRRAGRVHVVRGLGLATMIALLSWGAIEIHGNSRASAMVESLETAGISEVPGVIERYSGYRRWTNSRLRSMLLSSAADSGEKLRASLALLPVDPSQVGYLETRLLASDPGDYLVLRQALRPYKALLAPKLWDELDSARPGESRLLTAAGALALYDPGDVRWADSSAKIASAMVAVNPIHLGVWLEALRPVKGRLIAPLGEIFHRKNLADTQQTLVTSILGDYTSDVPDILTDLLMDAEPKAYTILFSVVEKHQDQALPLLKAELDKKIDPTAAEERKDRMAERQARAAVAMARMGEAESVWPLLRYGDDPRLRSFIINWLKPLGVDIKEIAAEFGRLASLPRPVEPGEAGRRPEGSSPATALNAILFDEGTSKLRALIMALGAYQPEQMPRADFESLTGKLLDLYRKDPDSGIHGAAEWTLRRWKKREPLKLGDDDLKEVSKERRWSINQAGQTFAVIDGPVAFDMGSSPADPEKAQGSPQPRRILIPRRFALATKEVTVEQFDLFLRAHPEFAPEKDGEGALSSAAPSLTAHASASHGTRPPLIATG